MSTLILIYHRVSGDGGGATNLHWLPARNFREQIERLGQLGCEVISWRRLFGDVTRSARLQVALTFDDGYRSDVASAHMLHALGYDALFFIATDHLNKSDYVTRADVLRLHRLGMGIGSHSHHHKQLVALSDAEVEAELSQSKQILEDILGIPVLNLSFPGGSYDARILAIARRSGYRCFFTTQWGVNRTKQYASGVLRRTAVRNDLDLDDFDRLLRLRHYYARQLVFQAKEVTKKTLGMDHYVRVRRALLNRMR
jgi:peptidoglycan/xylan/chitin deacetylase (PgdA/CDA1 family)